MSRPASIASPSWIPCQIPPAIAAPMPMTAPAMGIATKVLIRLSPRARPPSSPADAAAPTTPSRAPSMSSTSAVTTISAFCPWRAFRLVSAAARSDCAFATSARTSGVASSFCNASSLAVRSRTSFSAAAISTSTWGATFVFPSLSRTRWRPVTFLSASSTPVARPLMPRCAVSTFASKIARTVRSATVCLLLSGWCGSMCADTPGGQSCGACRQCGRSNAARTRACPPSAFRGTR